MTTKILTSPVPVPVPTPILSSGAFMMLELLAVYVTLRGTKVHSVLIDHIAKGGLVILWDSLL